MPKTTQPKGRVDERLVRRVRENLRALVVERFDGVQRRFALALGVQPTLVSRWLNPKANVLPSATELHRIGTVTRWSIDWLLTGEGPTRRGGAPIDRTLGAQLRAYLLSHPALEKVSGVQIAEGPELATHRMGYTAGLAAQVLPADTDEILQETAYLWVGELERYSDGHVAAMAIAERFPKGIRRSERERLVEYYGQTQRAIREARSKDLGLALGFEVAGAEPLGKKKEKPKAFTRKRRSS
jgi:hypothetical protein